MNKKFVSLVLVVVVLLALIPQNMINAHRKFTESQQRNADKIAEIVSENWDKYGVLPSIAIAQAFIESTLGDNCTGYNLWGIKSGEEQYGSLEEGVYRYMKVINNGYYKRAPFCNNYKEQIRIILDGGYCTPVGNYYNNVIWTIQTYGLYQYDRQMFEDIEQAEKDKKVENRYLKKMNKPLEPFVAHNDNKIDEYVIMANKETICGGCVSLYIDNKFAGIYEVVCDNTLVGNNIRINNKKINNKKIYLQVYEDAVG